MTLNVSIQNPECKRTLVGMWQLEYTDLSRAKCFSRNKNIHVLRKITWLDGFWPLCCVYVHICVHGVYLYCSCWSIVDIQCYIGSCGVLISSCWFNTSIPYAVLPMISVVTVNIQCCYSIIDYISCTVLFISVTYFITRNLYLLIPFPIFCALVFNLASPNTVLLIPVLFISVLILSVPNDDYHQVNFRVF